MSSCVALLAINSLCESSSFCWVSGLTFLFPTNPPAKSLRSWIDLLPLVRAIRLEYPWSIAWNFLFSGMRLANAFVSSSPRSSSACPMCCAMESRRSLGRQDFSQICSGGPRWVLHEERSSSRAFQGRNAYAPTPRHVGRYYPRIGKNSRIRASPDPAVLLSNVCCVLCDQVDEPDQHGAGGGASLE